MRTAKTDQTGRMPRLICDFAGRTCHLVGFVVLQLRWYWTHCCWMSDVKNYWPHDKDRQVSAISRRPFVCRSKAVLLLWFLTVTCSCCPYLFFVSAIMLVTYFVNFRKLNDHLFGKELFIRFTACAFRKLQSVYVFSYFPFDFEDRMWDLIVSVPDHCLFFTSHNLKHLI